MEWLLIGAIVVVLLMVLQSKKQQKEQEEAAKQARKLAIAELAEKAQRECNKMSSLKTTTAQANAAGRALGYLKQTEQYPEAREVVQNLDEMKKRLAAAKRVLPAIAAVEKPTSSNSKETTNQS